MKKFIRILFSIIIFSTLCISLIACDNNVSDDNKSPQIGNTHSVKINSEQLFNYYFTFDTTNEYLPYYNFNTNGPSKLGTNSTSTITISPKLRGFVDYSGYVILKANIEDENKSERVLEDQKSARVLKDRKINIDYWGTATDVYNITNQDQRNDETISFNNVNYKFSSADIIITYHHEGLSGMPNLSYETIFITKYNFKSYLSITINNQSYYTTSYDDSDYNHRHPIYTYHYYQTYTVTPSTQIKSYKEFNNVVLYFDNGINIALDALGTATYKSSEYSLEKPIPSLSKIVGCIDFYPSATYEY